MSRFSILRIDHYDPAAVGRKNRILFSIFVLIPASASLLINLGNVLEIDFILRIIILLPVLGIAYFFLLRKLRSAIKKIKPIGDIEITRSSVIKRIGDAITRYDFDSIKEIRLTKHLPATRIRESKSGYFSYILKIVFHDIPNDTIVVSDRSIDHDHKISITDTLKTLKKIVSFEVIIEQ
jgi:hypothetical protein